MGHYLLKDSPKTGTGDLLVSVQAVEPIAVPILKDTTEIDALFEQRMKKAINESEINAFVYRQYALCEEEISYIESREN